MIARIETNAEAGVECRHVVEVSGKGGGEDK
jgi:hypothetical protein